MHMCEWKERTGSECLTSLGLLSSLALIKYIHILSVYNLIHATPVSKLISPALVQYVYSIALDDEC